MKVAVSGKGGVGKTTVSALLAREAANSGRSVVAVDADPDANLGGALGFPPEVLAELRPIVELKEIIAERTGSEPGGQGGWFVLNPRVDDIPDRFCVEFDGIRLMAMGGVRGGGAGCACPESAFLMHLLRHIVVTGDEPVVVDMEAGLEHMGRGTARAVDVMLVVVEPGRRSLDTARQVRSLARELGISRLAVVANKVRAEDREIIERLITTDLELPLLAVIDYDGEIARADLEGRPVWQTVPELLGTATKIREGVDALLAGEA